MERDLRIKLSEHIQEWLVLLDKRIIELEKVFQKYKAADDSLHYRNVYLIGNIKNFHRITSFINSQLVNDADNAQMYLCQLRTIADILSKLIFLLSLNIDEGAQVALCEDILQIKKIDTDLALRHYEDLIEKSSIFKKIPNFPKKENISKKALAKLQSVTGTQLLMPTFEDRLVSKFVDSKKFITASLANAPVRIGLMRAHTAFSQHVHGNHLFNEQNGNEIFWLYTYCLTLVPFACEILDTEILSKEKAGDIRKLIETTISLKQEMVVIWESKKLSRKNRSD